MKFIKSKWYIWLDRGNLTEWRIFSGIGCKCWNTGKNGFKVDLKFLHVTGVLFNSYRKIKIKFEKIELFFSKLRKGFFNFLNSGNFGNSGTCKRNNLTFWVTEV